MIMVAYIQDMSNLLTPVSDVRERSIERHMEVEWTLLPKLFAIEHPNHVRFLI